MRQGQSSNRQRSRGRNNNNRNRGGNNSNNVNRSMESNGPDVRIRGTASTIAEKYQQLARDSHSAGDIVAAESYWQHAEHYNRLIAAAQAAQNQAREEQRAQQGNDGDSSDDADGGNRNRGRNNRGRNRAEQEAGAEKNNGEATEAMNGSGPQPTISDTPAEVALAEVPANGTAEEGQAPKKPRKARRPRKSTSDDDAPIVEAETKAELPAFISGGDE